MEYVNDALNEKKAITTTTKITPNVMPTTFNADSPLFLNLLNIRRLLILFEQVKNTIEPLVAHLTSSRE